MRKRVYLFENRIVKIAYVLCVLLVGVAYLMAQYIILAEAVDALFVFISSAMAIFLALRSGSLTIAIKKTALLLSDDVNENTYSPDEFWGDINRVLSNKLAITTGLAFAAYHVFNRISMGIWMDEPPIMILFLLMSFFANFITGCVLYSLAYLMVVMMKWINHMRFDGWHSRSEEIMQIRNLKFDIIITGMIYVSITLSTTGLSLIPIGEFIYGYTVFAILVVMVAFLLPEMNIYRKLRVAKNSVIHDLDRRIKVVYNAMIDEDDLNKKKEYFEAVKDLFEARRLIREKFQDQGFANVLAGFVPIIAAAVAPGLIQILIDLL
jgi:hypothetical protein